MCRRSELRETPCEPQYNRGVPEARLDLRFGGGTLSVRVQLPAEPIRPVDLLPVLHEFNDALIGAAVEQTESQGARISCRARLRRML